MNTRRFLILAPAAVFIILLQSYFWVPTYEEQTKGDPKRLEKYITASIGDASVLNPILSADSASSNINTMVFEGLIDRDEELRYRGRVAGRWEIYEEAYIYVKAGNGPGGARGVIEKIRAARRAPQPYEPHIQESLRRIRKIDLIPPRPFTQTVEIALDGKAKTPVLMRVSAPERIKLTLNEVDQNIFSNLAQIIGDDTLPAFNAGDFLESEPALAPEVHAQYSRRFLPATEHNPVIVFYLRPGVRFHDGHPLDAHDVKFTYESIMNPGNLSPRTPDYEPVKSVEVIDPLTVKIVYKRLYSPAIGTWQMGILPSHLLDEEALKEEALRRGRDPDKFGMRDSLFNRDPVGSGPFKFAQWKSDQFIELVRFEDYWEGPPQYAEYVYRIVPDILTQEMEFYAGTVDSYVVQPHQVARLKQDDRFQNFSGVSFGYSYIGYNMRRKPFDDVRVRKALGMAIDVNKIIQYVLYNQAERITGPFVKQTDYYDHAIEPLPYDPGGALELLAQAGWVHNDLGRLERNGKPMEFTLITNGGNDQRKAIMAIAQDAWKQIGIDVRTDVVEWSVFIQERVNKLDFDALILGWSMGIDPDLYQIWHSSQTGPGQLNFVGFQNGEADELIIKIRQEYDFEQQVKFCHRLHGIIAREQPYTFLYVGKWTAVLDKRIVIRSIDAQKNIVYEKIQPTKTGDYTFYFNKWIKLPEAPNFSAEG